MHTLILACFQGLNLGDQRLYLRVLQPQQLLQLLDLGFKYLVSFSQLLQRLFFLNKNFGIHFSLHGQIAVIEMLHRGKRLVLSRRPVSVAGCKTPWFGAREGEFAVAALEALAKRGVNPLTP